MGEQMSVWDWIVAALMALAYIVGLYALVSWSDRMRRKQLLAIFEAIRERGVRTIVAQVEDTDER